MKVIPELRLLDRDDLAVMAVGSALLPEQPAAKRSEAW